MKATATLRSPLSPGWVSAAKLAFLPALLAASVLLGAAYGAVPTSLPEVVEIVLQQIGLPVGHSWSSLQVDIVWQIRMPEVITAALVGAGLSIAGVVFQAVLRNPLADPFVIGTSSGAAFGVAVAFVVFGSIQFVWLGFGAIQICAFVGALAAVAIVYALSRVGRQTPTLTFLLAGFAVSALMIAGMWLIAFESGRENDVLDWTMGSLSSSDWTQITIVGPTILILIAISLCFVRDLNALLLGEEQAGYLGLNAERSKLILICLASLVTALAVSIAGIIGFVGLVVPHVARLIYGPNHRLVLVGSAFLGAAYLSLSDLLAQLPRGLAASFPSE